MTAKAENKATDDDATAQAQNWVVRLASGEMTAEELSVFTVWLRESEAHERAFDHERAFWQRLSHIEPAFDKREQTGRAGRQSRWAPDWRIRGPLAAIAVAACLLLMVFRPDISAALLADYRTGSSGIRTLHLPDDSQVTLDRNSAIRLRFSGTLRQVELLQGEAFFEVRPDPQRPFRVLTAGGKSEALGTAYAVRRSGNAARVAVTEGRVAVTAQGRPDVIAVLRAGEGIRYADAGLLGGKFPVDGERALAWRRGKVVFIDRPLSDAVAELERYHPGRIFLLGGGHAYHRVSGVIDLSKLEDGIAALAATHGMTAFHVTPFLTVLR